VDAPAAVVVTAPLVESPLTANLAVAEDGFCGWTIAFGVENADTATQDVADKA
jgi:hypothetical protein